MLDLAATHTNGLGSMSILYDALMLFGCFVVLGVIVKGFWSAKRVKPIEQPDNWRNTHGNGNE